MQVYGQAASNNPLFGLRDERRPKIGPGSPTWAGGSPPWLGGGTVVLPTDTDEVNIGKLDKKKILDDAQQHVGELIEYSMALRCCISPVQPVSDFESSVNGKEAEALRLFSNPETHRDLTDAQLRILERLTRQLTEPNSAKLRLARQLLDEVKANKDKPYLSHTLMHRQI